MGSTRPIAALVADLTRLLAGPLAGPDSVLRLADEAAGHPDGLAAVPLLLAALEQHPELDWGTPGSVVHAVERFFGRGYEPLLRASVERAPTPHTLWMVRRVANGLTGSRQAEWLAVLERATGR